MRITAADPRPAFRIAFQGRRSGKACSPPARPPVTWVRAGWGGHGDGDEAAWKPTGNVTTETDSTGKGGTKTRRRNFSIPAE